MTKRDFPAHTAWSEAYVNGDHAIAFVAIQSLSANSKPTLHQVYHRLHFRRKCEALEAAEEALAKLLHVDEHGRPVFSSADC